MNGASGSQGREYHNNLAITKRNEERACLPEMLQGKNRESLGTDLMTGSGWGSYHLNSKQCVKEDDSLMTDLRALFLFGECVDGRISSHYSQTGKLMPPPNSCALMYL